MTLSESEHYSILEAVVRRDLKEMRIQMVNEKYLLWNEYLESISRKPLIVKFMKYTSDGRPARVIHKKRLSAEEYAKRKQDMLSLSYRGVTLEEIGKKFDISRQRVFQILHC